MLDTLVGVALGLVIGLLVGLVAFVVWRAKHAGAIRADAVAKSRAVTVGKVSEQLVPYLPGFGYNPKDARFLGSPVDFVVFDGLDAGALERVVFLEVKTGGAALSTRERQVRDAVESGRIAWDELRITSKRQLDPET
ncbi:MAG TPA: Holliday junction resolvase-like protein [Gemmatimonadales bacterium]|nr:Holliday junction resolvase-like protein [Gemmatimonadales bacterium]